MRLCPPSRLGTARSMKPSLSKSAGTMLVADSAGMAMHAARTGRRPRSGRRSSAWPVGRDDVNPAVAVQVGDGRVSRGPFRHAPGAGDRELTLAVVQVDELLVGRVVARQHVEIAVAIEVRERRGVGSIRGRARGPTRRSLPCRRSAARDRVAACAGPSRARGPDPHPRRDLPCSHWRNPRTWSRGSRRC